jgi:hypothetical protein
VDQPVANPTCRHASHNKAGPAELRMLHLYILVRRSA